MSNEIVPNQPIGFIEKLEFEGAEIRRITLRGIAYYSVIDVIASLTESADPANYWRVMKARLKADGADQTITNCNGFKLPAPDGKMRTTDCADVQTLLRLIQSIPSRKAEPFKLWLAKAGYERFEEGVSPDKALERLINIYLSQGRTPDWIRERIDGIITRRELTDEWHGRGIENKKHYAILTRMLQIRSLGIGPKEHRELKSLKPSQSLRDHSNELELLFTRLGERSTIEVARAKDAQGYEENKGAVEAGGNIAKKARLDLEAQIGRPIVSQDNFLPKPAA